MYIKAHGPTYATIYYGGDIKMIVLMKNNQSGSLGWNWFGWTLAHVSVQHCSEKEAAFGSQIACQPSGMETGAKSPFNLWVFALVSPCGDHLPVISDPEHPVNSLNTSDQSNLRQSRLVVRVKISVLINYFISNRENTIHFNSRSNHFLTTFPQLFLSGAVCFVYSKPLWLTLDLLHICSCD